MRFCGIRLRAMSQWVAVLYNEFVNHTFRITATSHWCQWEWHISHWSYFAGVCSFVFLGFHKSLNFGQDDLLQRTRKGAIGPDSQKNSVSFEICNNCIHYRPKVWIILKHNGSTRIWRFDLLEITWHQPQPSIGTLMYFSCIVLGGKIQLAMSEIKATQVYLWGSVISQYFA